ncbi:TetR/AcrR family transcriptional regulator [Arthrobacter sp. APC 3897]|uniref:TetR/AcrR family transcriptional regulator n=1 Tax=Arthrobacter sp. APC 3897 TaxID=3035204 RepID=UPI0025B350C9|nr:TetR/AcrR family transcriptional regulator [Arthrobacter sp. APC 3897]MDN3482384.1 TetR/AcrR family transcriptional regulator [Arthrobacter sp. APC 3897]
MNTSRRNARGEVSLQTILAKTVSLVSRYGYDGTTIARITRVTGRPASSIYWYFDTKDGLIAAALESTYRRRADEAPGWPDFDPETPLAEQLFRVLGADFTPAPTEAPVRLGIMIALEGNAAGSPAQEPFRGRRQRVRRQLAAWWKAAAEARFGSPREDIAEWMTMLTIAFLDGHYISDVPPVHRGGTLVAAALSAAFEELLSREHLLPPAIAGAPDFAGKDTAHPEPGSPEFLLSATRSLVAESGYEGATLARICERSQMQRSSIYWRYQNKETLIREAVSEPFLSLMNAPHTDPRSGTGWSAALAGSLVGSVEGAMRCPDTVKAGLLLKLQRRDPPSLGGEAIQLGMAREFAALDTWIAAAAGSAGTTADPAGIGWAANVLREGLMLGVAFGQTYDTALLSALVGAMIEGTAGGTDGQLG